MIIQRRKIFYLYFFKVYYFSLVNFLWENMCSSSIKSRFFITGSMVRVFTRKGIQAWVNINCYFKFRKNAFWNNNISIIWYKKFFLLGSNYSKLSQILISNVLLLNQKKNFGSAARMKRSRRKIGHPKRFGGWNLKIRKRERESGVCSTIQ